MFLDRYTQPVSVWKYVFAKAHNFFRSSKYYSSREMVQVSHLSAGIVKSFSILGLLKIKFFGFNEINNEVSLAVPPTTRRTRMIVTKWISTLLQNKN